MDAVLLSKKLELLKEYLAELKPLTSLETDAVLADSFKYHTAERLFQLVVDEAVDINTQLLKERGGKLPDDLQSTFIALGQANILPLALAEKMAPAVGLRNRIIHRYETLDRKTFVELLKKNLPDFDNYLAVVIQLAQK